MSEKNENVLEGAKAPKGKDTAPAVVAKDEPKLSISLSELAELVKAAVSSSQSENARIIAEALIESKKPYLDPRHAANEAAMRQSEVELQEQIKKRIKASQASCPHMQGCHELSDFSGQLTSIVQHRLDNGDIVGICTNCQRTFKPEDPDYLEWMKKKSGNRLSQAGIRMYYRPPAPVAPVPSQPTPAAAGNAA